MLRGPRPTPVLHTTTSLQDHTRIPAYRDVTKAGFERGQATTPKVRCHLSPKNSRTPVFFVSVVRIYKLREESEG